MIGGFGANHHLRQSLVFLNVIPLQQPEAYIGGADKLFEGDQLVNPTTREFLTKYLQTLAEIATENNSTTLFPVPIDLLQPLLAARGKAQT